MRLIASVHLLFWVSIVSIHAQNIKPGGVEGASIWIQSDAEKLVEITQQVSWKVDRHEAQINFHPAYIPNSISMDRPNTDLNQATFFTVVNATQDREQPLWQIEKEKVLQSLMTTHRIADLQHFEFLNLNQRAEEKPYISTYYHHLKSDSIPTTFVLGPAPKGIELASLSDGIGEVIVFDRVISPLEKSQIESYLSIKFGIPLNQSIPTHYYNSHGQIIWNAVAHQSYPHALAGLGRDIYSGLNQKQSTSEFITMYVGQLAKANDENRFQLSNDEFLFWSHDGEELKWAETKSTNLREVKRKWKVVLRGFNDQSVSLQLDARMFPLSPQKNETLWLYQYDDLSAGLELDRIHAYPLRYDDQKEMYTGSEIIWDQDASGSDIFSVGVAPFFHAVVQYHQPICAQEDGKIELKILGGEAPYNVKLINRYLGSIQEIETSVDYINLDGLSTGAYTIEILDAQKQSFHQFFHLNPSNGPIIPLESTYTLKESKLQLDISEFLQTEGIQDFYWERPDGSHYMNQQISTDQIGTYQLVIFQSGCETVHHFEILPSFRGNLKLVNLYPNPLRVGSDLYAFIELHHPGLVDLKIVDNQGRVLNHKQVRGKREFVYRHQIEDTGHYFLIIEQLGIIESFPFVVI